MTENMRPGFRGRVERPADDRIRNSPSCDSPNIVSSEGVATRVHGYVQGREPSQRHSTEPPSGNNLVQPGLPRDRSKY